MCRSSIARNPLCEEWKFILILTHLSSLTYEFICRVKYLLTVPVYSECLCIMFTIFLKHTHIRSIITKKTFEKKKPRGKGIKYPKKKSCMY